MQINSNCGILCTRTHSLGLRRTKQSNLSPFPFSTVFHPLTQAINDVDMLSYYILISYRPQRKNTQEGRMRSTKQPLQNTNIYICISFETTKKLHPELKRWLSQCEVYSFWFLQAQFLELICLACREATL